MIEFILEITDGLQEIVSQCAYDRVISTLAIAIPCISLVGSMWALCGIFRMFSGGRR